MSIHLEKKAVSGLKKVKDPIAFQFETPHWFGVGSNILHCQFRILLC
jgi:hypothetical protein